MVEVVQRFPVVESLVTVGDGRVESGQAVRDDAEVEAYVQRDEEYGFGSARCLSIFGTDILSV